MKLFLLLFAVSSLSCNSDKRDYTTELSAVIALKQAEALAKQTDSIPNCPIKILKSYVSHDEYETPTLSVVLKNTGTLPVDAIEIKTTCSNNFGDFLGFHYGISQKTLLPKSTKKYTWNLYEFRQTTKVFTIIYKIHFKENTASI